MVDAWRQKYDEANAAYLAVNELINHEELVLREYSATYVSNFPARYKTAFEAARVKGESFYNVARTTPADLGTEQTNIRNLQTLVTRRYNDLIANPGTGFTIDAPISYRFAGVYFSDGHDPVEIRKTEQTKRAAEMYCGVVAVSGVVPLLCCDADVGRFTRGDEMFLALRTKTGGRYTESTDYCQIVRPDKEDNVYPMDEVAFATTGEFSHQQLAVAPVCLKPPEPPSDASNPNGVVWGCPRFAPVVLEADQGDMYPSVTGAVHAGARGSLDVGNVFTQSGARVFRIVDRDTLLASANSFAGAAPLDDTAKAKLLEDHFIGNFVSKIGDGGGCMVRLGGLLLRTA